MYTEMHLAMLVKGVLLEGMLIISLVRSHCLLIIAVVWVH